MNGPGAHFVVKRGHHGRYRFTMINEAGRITGEIHVDADAGSDRSAARRRALWKIASLAEALSAIVVKLDPAPTDCDIEPKRASATVVRGSHSGHDDPNKGDRHGAI